MAGKTSMRISKETNRKLQLLKCEQGLKSGDDAIVYLLAQNIRQQHRINTLLDKQAQL